MSSLAGDDEIGSNFDAAIPTTSSIAGNGSTAAASTVRIDESLVAIDLMDETNENGGDDEPDEYWTASEVCLTDILINI
jgi:hypothetical protein